MTVVLALPRLYDAVQATFEADGLTDVDMRFGWRESAAQKQTSRRIVWTPGDPSGVVGAVGPARFPGRNPRPIGTLDERFTVEISAVDPSQPEDERAQYQATRELFDAWYRAVYLAARQTFEIESSRWDRTKTLRQRGAQIVVVGTIQSMIPDAPLETAPVDTSASVTPSLDAVDDGTGTADPAFTAP